MQFMDITVKGGQRDNFWKASESTMLTEKVLGLP